MSDSQKLKDRFNKLQLKIHAPSAEVASKEASQTMPTAVELPLSLQPELHQQLRNDKSGQLNWKKALKATSEKISVTGRSELTPLMLERAIQQIAKKRIIVSVCQTHNDDAATLNRLTTFISARNNLFKDIFDTATVCLVRVLKGRAVIEVNSYETGAIEFIGQRLEHEAARSGSTLSSYKVENKDGWLSIMFNISEKSIRSFEEISQ